MSLRRHYITKMLGAQSLEGRVLDVGGNKTDRGYAQLSRNAATSWKALNIDAKAEPDYLCSAESIPVEDCSFETVLLIEVLEHLSNPETVLKEISRVLGVGGKLVLSVPLLTPLHGCPYDFQRWSADKLRMEVEKQGFSVELLQPMGGIVAVVADLISKYARKSESRLTKSIVRRGIKLLTPVLLAFDRRLSRHDRITTGYFLAAVKQDSAHGAKT